MKSLLNYILWHINESRQDNLLLVVTIYGKNARSVWSILGYRSIREFDRALSQARSNNIKRRYKNQ